MTHEKSSRLSALAFLATVAAYAFTLVLACSKHETEKESASSNPALHVAVAANFATPAEKLARAFEAESGTPVQVSTGSTGKLYAQIENGAPFHVFLSADVERPILLEKKKLAQPKTRFTYAQGRLALYGKLLRHSEDGPRDLEDPGLKHLALANPKTAPYGVAARQAMEKLGMWTKLEPRIVQGENIAQTYQFTESGSAELGFVALSSVIEEPKDRYWLVPEALHDPIQQDAVLLARGAKHPAAKEFLAFLKAPRARAIIEAAGYHVP